MANISDVGGTFSLLGNWSRNDIVNFLLVVNSLSGCYYDTCLGDTLFESMRLLEDTHEIKFYGSGRWTYQTNLEMWDNWSSASNADIERIKDYAGLPKAFKLTKQSYSNRRNNLLRSMLKKDLSIAVSCRESECGCGFISIAEGELKAKQTDKGPIFIYNNTKCDNYDYNLKNLCSLIYDGDNDTLVELVKELTQLMSIDEKYNDAIVQLIMSEEDWYHLNDCPPDEVAELPAKLVDDINKLIARV